MTTIRSLGRYRSVDGRVLRRVSDAAQKTHYGTFPNAGAERDGDDLCLTGADGKEMGRLHGQHWAAETEGKLLKVYQIAGDDGMPGVSVAGVLGEDGGRDGRTVGDENMAALRKMNADNARVFGRLPWPKVVLHEDTRGTLAGMNRANAQAWGKAG